MPDSLQRDPIAESRLPAGIAHSVCPHDCASACPLEVERIDERRIGAVRGSPANDYNDGVICAKVARYAERVHHPERLSVPLRRVGARGDKAAFRPLSWDQALDAVAEGIARAAQRDGSEAVWPYFYAGTMGLVQRDGINRLRHALRHSRQNSTICTALGDAGWAAGVGVKYGPDPREMAESDLIVVWGGNPVHTQVHVMSLIAKARKARGAKLVVIDPYRTATAAQADMHLMLRPGTDGALACAAMHVLFAEGYADRAYMARYADCPEALEAHLRTRTPAWAAAITGLPVEQIEAFARLYGRTKRSFVRLGYGFSRSRNGAAQMHAASCLPTVTGAWQHRGGGALYGTSMTFEIDRTLIEGLDLMDRSTRNLDQSRIGPVLCGDRRDLGDGPPVTALLIQSTNPMVVCPEHAKVREGFNRDDLFVCVHEQFMTETAAMADIVLPATTSVEHDDIYLSYGHTYLSVARRVIEPHAEARSNHEVICGLAKLLGARHPGFEMTAWEMVDATLRASGLPGADAVHAGRWLDCAKDFESAHFLNGFGTSDGKFHFSPDWAAIGRDAARMPDMPDHLAVIEEADDEHPFRMVTAPSRQFLNSSFTETPTSRLKERRPEAMMHPRDLAALGIGHGDRVRIGNRRGSVVLHARRFEGLQPGVVVIESVWPNAAFEEGVGINLLTSADPGLPKGGAVFHDTAVWIRPAPLADASRA